MYDEEKPAVLAEMRKIVTQVEQRPNHPWHTLLGNLTSESVRAAY
jgi:hypothetical protein